ncbi:MAG: DPP IV N-terminal domain-containing protein, partial [Candidatus Eremiobacteraeota bacterium]|nr:DPP IV N-terminal domain-containing protein [Candidatus Eremiobacteraeota bacterium]
MRRPLVVAVAAAAAASVLIAGPAFAVKQPSQRVLEGKDLRALVALLDPQIAPDGKHIALIVRRPDFVKNKYRNELALVDARNGATRTLVRERDDVSSARWSPAGDRLAFVATPPKDPDDKDEPSPQLYVLRMDGGEPARITDAKKGVESFAWRPDGRAFAYVARNESPDAARIKAHDDWFEITDNAWTTRANRAPAHLWTIGADGKKPHRVTQGTWSVESEPAFAPDGRRVYVTRTPRASTNHYRARAVVAIDLATGTLRTIASAPSSDAPAVSPDGKH